MENQIRALNKAGMFRGVPTATASLKTADKTLEDIDALLEECHPWSSSTTGSSPQKHSSPAV